MAFPPVVTISEEATLIQAFVLILNNAISGLPSGLSSNASIYSLLVNNDNLYIGGSFTSTISSNYISSLAIYDFTTSGW